MAPSKKVLQQRAREYNKKADQFSRELRATQSSQNQLREQSRKYKENANRQLKESTERLQNGLERNHSEIQQARKNRAKIEEKIAETKRINARNSNIQQSQFDNQLNRQKQQQTQ